MKRCSHPKVKTVETLPFTGSVAVYPYTNENMAAHGNVCLVELCQECAKTRKVNVNQWHVEFGVWGVGHER